MDTKSIGNTSGLDPEKAGYVEKHPENTTYVMDELPTFDAAKADHFGETAVLQSAGDILTHVIHVQDNPSLSPWTFRAFFLGM